MIKQRPPKMKRECFYFTLLWSDFVNILVKKRDQIQHFKKLDDYKRDNCVNQII